MQPRFLHAEMQRLHDILELLQTDNSAALDNPHAHRILEAVSYLTSQVRDEIDNKHVDFLQELLSTLAPQLVSPYPSHTILQFAPVQRFFHKSLTIPANTEIESIPTDTKENSCRFSTTHDLRLLPITIDNIEYHENHHRAYAEIKITMSKPSQLPWHEIPLSDLTFYIDRDSASAKILFYVLTSQIHSITFSCGSQDVGQLTQCKLVPKIFKQGTFTGLLDYFAFAHQYLFIKLSNLDTIDWESVDEQINFHFILKQPLEISTVIDNNCLRLHCIPARNVYQAPSTAITAKHAFVEYAIAPENDSSLPHLPIALAQINSIAPSSGLRYALLNHKDNVASATALLYQLRPPKTRNEGWHIALHSLPNDEPLILSCDMMVCNGDAPQHAINYCQWQMRNDHALAVKIKNLCVPSKMLSPPLKEHYYASALAMIHMQQDKVDVNTLKKLLTLFYWDNSPQFTNMFENIIHCDITHHNEVIRGAFQQIRQVDIKIQVDNPQDKYEVYLFSLALHHYLSLSTPLGYEFRTRITVLPTKEVLLWL